MLKGRLKRMVIGKGHINYRTIKNIFLSVCGWEGAMEMRRDKDHIVGWAKTMGAWNASALRIEQRPAGKMAASSLGQRLPRVKTEQCSWATLIISMSAGFFELLAWVCFGHPVTWLGILKRYPFFPILRQPVMGRGLLALPGGALYNYGNLQ